MSMIEINPYELDLEQARCQFYDYQKRIFKKFANEMQNLLDDLEYILLCRSHPYDFSCVDNEILGYLEKKGLKIIPVEPEKDNKANQDYYLALFFGLETVEYFFKNYKNMVLDAQFDALSYAQKQLAVLENLSPTGQPKHKPRNTEGQSKGAKAANKNRYMLTRQRAKIEWDEHKRTLPEWHKFKNNPKKYAKEIEIALRGFEKAFFNSLTGMRLNGANSEIKKMLDEKYTDSMQNPPLAIGWIKEIEELPNKQKEQADQKREQRRIDKMMERWNR